jgi:hypothetical protein
LAQGPTRNALARSQVQELSEQTWHKDLPGMP